MSKRNRYRVVLVTAPNLPTARRIARVALESKLAACANLVPRIESHYWWRGRIESGREVLVILKTTATALPALERRILAEHPYDTAEFIALRIAAGSRRYLSWLGAAVEQSL